MRCTTIRRCAGATLVAVAALIVLAAPAVANEEFTISGPASTPAVAQGATATHTFTLTDTPRFACAPVCDEPIKLELVLSRHATYSKASIDQFLSVSTPFGPCTLGVDAGYPAAFCDLGTRGTFPPMLQVVATIKADESFDDTAVFSQVAVHPAIATEVVRAPVITGSKKIVLSGLPKACAPGDLTVKARIKATNIARIAASLTGATDEWGVNAEGRGAGGTALAHGSTVSIKVPGAKYRRGTAYTISGLKYYSLQFTATIKHHPSQKIKTSVFFQLC